MGEKNIKIQKFTPLIVKLAHGGNFDSFLQITGDID